MPNKVGDTLCVDDKEKLYSLNRLIAFRQINNFRTVSEETVLILAKTISIEILADEVVVLLPFRVSRKNSSYKGLPCANGIHYGRTV